METNTQTRGFRALFTIVLSFVGGFCSTGVMHICAAILDATHLAEGTVEVTTRMVGDDLQVYCEICAERDGATPHTVVFYVNQQGRVCCDCLHVSGELPESVGQAVAAIGALVF